MLAEIGRPEAMERLHAPAGLDIGAEGPEEVARAIVAEILAVTRGRPGGALRERHGPIHEG
jgi:xanthine/CO dehydrogenase XdhC/CoxF family maturation factor